MLQFDGGKARDHASQRFESKFGRLAKSADPSSKTCCSTDFALFYPPLPDFNLSENFGSDITPHLSQTTTLLAFGIPTHSAWRELSAKLICVGNTTNDHEAGKRNLNGGAELSRENPVDRTVPRLDCVRLRTFACVNRRTGTSDRTAIDTSAVIPYRYVTRR